MFCVRNTYQNSEVKGELWLHRCDGVVKTPKELKGDQITIFGETLTFKSQKVFPSVCTQCKKRGVLMKTERKFPLTLTYDELCSIIDSTKKVISDWETSLNPMIFERKLLAKLEHEEEIWKELK